MRMSPDHFVIYRFNNLIYIKLTSLFCHLTMKDDLKQQIPKFIAQISHISLLNSV